MKRKYCYSTTCRKCKGKLLQEFIQYSEFIIYFYSQCLKAALTGFFDRLLTSILWKKFQGFCDDLLQSFCCRYNRSSFNFGNYSFTDAFGIWFICIFYE